MGIRDFWKVVEARAPWARRSFKLMDLGGLRAAVDVSVFAHRFAKAENTPFLLSFFLLLSLLRRNGVGLVCVFDGPDVPEEKKEERAKRRKARVGADERRSRCLEALSELGDGRELDEEFVSECKEAFGRPRNHFEVDWSSRKGVRSALALASSRLERSAAMATKSQLGSLRDLLEALGIPSLDASGEAEALCSSLAIAGECDCVITNDTDVLAYGAPWMITVEKFNSDSVEVRGASSEELSGCFGNLVDLCILLGCDYNSRAKLKDGKSVGPVRALELIDKHGRLEDIVEELGDPSVLRWERCREIFANPEQPRGVPKPKPPNFKEVRRILGHAVPMDKIRDCWGRLRFENSDPEARGAPDSANGGEVWSSAVLCSVGFGGGV